MIWKFTLFQSLKGSTSQIRQLKSNSDCFVVKFTQSPISFWSKTYTCTMFRLPHWIRSRCPSWSSFDSSVTIVWVLIHLCVCFDVWQIQLIFKLKTKSTKQRIATYRIYLRIRTILKKDKYFISSLKTLKTQHMVLVFMSETK